MTQTVILRTRRRESQVSGVAQTGKAQGKVAGRKLNSQADP